MNDQQIRAWRERWSDIDRTNDPASFIRLLDTVWQGDPGSAGAYPVSGFLKASAGDILLDVGCGLGSAVRALAPDVGKTGRIIGVDNSATMIDEARRRSEGLDLPITFRVADAHHLPFADATFDGCYVIDAIEFVDHPRQVVAELIRVTWVGGRIVVSATDFGSWIFDSTDQALTRRIMAFVCDHESHGTIARQLRRLFVEAGLADVKMVLRIGGYTDLAPIRDVWLHSWLADAIEARVITEDEAAAWLGDLEAKDRQGLFLLGATGFVVSGRRS